MFLNSPSQGATAYAYRRPSQAFDKLICAEGSSAYNGPHKVGVYGPRPRRKTVSQDGRHIDVRGAAGEIVGALWFIGWLFTVAYAQLVWWQSLLALVIWPYYLGLAAR